MVVTLDDPVLFTLVVHRLSVIDDLIVMATFFFCPPHLMGFGWMHWGF